MVDEETRRKLRELGMGEMVEALDLQESDGISMAVAFDDRIWIVFSTVSVDKIGVMISTK